MKNKLPLDQIFTSFYEAEWFLKRNYQAWLVKDELFIDYLMEEAKRFVIKSKDMDLRTVLCVNLLLLGR